MPDGGRLPAIARAIPKIRAGGGAGGDADRRRALLVVALAFARLGEPRVRRWLGGWTGVGLVAAGMARQGYDLALTRYAELGWRATFYVAGPEHSPPGATGSAAPPAPVARAHAGGGGGGGGGRGGPPRACARPRRAGARGPGGVARARRPAVARDRLSRERADA